jgi:hypothetical protein
MAAPPTSTGPQPVAQMADGTLALLANLAIDHADLAGLEAAPADPRS